MRRVLWLLMLLAVGAHAAANIWIRAGEAYGIEPRLLYAISKVESNLRPLVISVNYKKLTKSQEDKLCFMLENRNISYNIYSKVIEIDSKNIAEAKGVVDFLDHNRYPSFDIGLMQINNMHKETLAGMKIPLHELLNESTNLSVAANILWECYKKHRSSDKAINAYNGSSVGNSYYTKVSAELRKLLLLHENGSKRLFYRII
ncbi:MAG: lytic transglycosylase domain-containing protein [Sulfurimonas sp.]|uniref:lytic transglycosylase domain-containing protein n=1 Tax=Sulfurimonas sp. TaxID=2022749 RepID=UPI00261FCE5D|nr:lytic transglycosylase domain-containing protein [Sulfurimonas sp.]MDD5372329.1 lytic transglycosylase domain-containing protein [Sulfurimonas sp.]